MSISIPSIQDKLRCAPTIHFFPSILFETQAENSFGQGF